MSRKSRMESRRSTIRSNNNKVDRVANKSFFKDSKHKSDELDRLLSKCRESLK